MIVRVKLSPGFLEKDCPKFGLVCRAESRAGTAARNQVVDNHRRFNSIYVEIDHVDASFVSFFSFEHPFDFVRSFSKR